MIITIYSDEDGRTSVTVQSEGESAEDVARAYKDTVKELRKKED